jgi:glyoxalase family protein
MIEGIHHVTATAGDPNDNLNFYTQTLGLRLVKKTVNFDDPGAYHLYFGDTTGQPGTILTFFPWPQAHPGQPGRGQVTAAALAVPHNTVEHWVKRLREKNVNFWGPDERFGAFTLGLEDPDGLHVELIEQSGPTTTTPWTGRDIPLTQAARGFHSVTLTVGDYEPTADLLTDVLDYHYVSQEGDRHRLATPGEGPGSVIDIRNRPGEPAGRPGKGTVHHVAFRVPTAEAQKTVRQQLVSRGLSVTPIKDRKYFKSIYFHGPSGILYEIATSGPGFLIDEDQDNLGSELQLPKDLENRRQEIENRLPRLGRATGE